MITSLKTRYEQLGSDRDPFLIKGREASALTIPSLLPPQGHTSTTVLPTPYQSIGAQGVNNLASKLLLTLLPPNTPCIRLMISDFDLKKLNETARGEIEEGLAQIEAAAMDDVETRALRVPVFEALKHLLVTGNALVYLQKNGGGAKVFRLDRYVVKRDSMGNILEIITKETIDRAMLPATVQDKLGKPEENESVYKNFDLYTGVFLQPDGKSYKGFQEVEGILVPGSEGVYKADKLPFIPLRLMRIDGESYGRGYVEEYLGDLISHDELSKAILDGSSAAARVIFLVSPNGTTKSSELTRARNGDFVNGSANDVTTLQLNKAADFSVAERSLLRLENRLSLVFLMNSSVQRQAERVTAEEIRFMAEELESALGGVYSLLSMEFQLPLMRLILNDLQTQKRIPKLPKEVKPVIVTGVEALGRGQDLNKLSTLIQFLAPLGQDVVRSEMNLSDLLGRIVASLGIKPLGLMKTEEQKQQEQQQAMAQQQQMMLAQTASGAIQRAAPEITKQVSQQQAVEPDQSGEPQ